MEVNHRSILAVFDFSREHEYSLWSRLFRNNSHWNCSISEETPIVVQEIIRNYLISRQNLFVWEVCNCYFESRDKLHWPTPGESSTMQAPFVRHGIPQHLIVFRTEYKKKTKSIGCNVFITLFHYTLKRKEMVYNIS